MSRVGTGGEESNGESLMGGSIQLLGVSRPQVTDLFVPSVCFQPHTRFQFPDTIGKTSHAYVL